MKLFFKALFFFLPLIVISLSFFLSISDIITFLTLYPSVTFIFFKFIKLTLLYIYWPLIKLVITFTQDKLFKFTQNNLDEFFVYSNIFTSWSIVHNVIGYIFTTNHKRIAINYYWFVVLSGSVGMGLATAIRFELAYPGLGIFAGDSLQYLSVVTAHGVIMVFFMIMPLLFGAFGNFLLPTQLGVHDVAFPRLNSAAFWFLPAGFLMLGQLLCIDRRYQRMNCFNIREAQSLLKKEFFTDLINSTDHRDLLNSTMISYRYKTSSNSSLKLNFTNFIDYGTSVFSLSDNLDSLNTNYTYTYFGTFYNTQTSNNPMTLLNSKLFDLVVWFTYYVSFSDLIALLSNYLLTPYAIYLNLVDTFYTSMSFWKISLSNIVFDSESLYFNIITSRKPLIFLFYGNFFTYKTFIVDLSLLPYYFFSNLPLNFFIVNYNFKLINYTNAKSTDNNQLDSIEITPEVRLTQLFEPLWRYDFRCGNYLRDNHIIHEWLKPVIFTSFANFRLPTWFLANEVSEPFTDLITFSNSNPITAQFLSDSFLNFPLLGLNPLLFSSLNSNYSIFNLRWASLNNLEFKFHNMFFSVSLQERIYSNWRSLKFSREAWRCKLLAARHQETMYRRYISEESLMWSIERNAKDLLPGWAMVTPFSARTRYTAIGKTDLGLMGVLLVLNSSIVSSANFLVTYRYLSTLNNRKMRDARSFFTEGLMVASWMMIAANPMLAIGIMMLLSDRHWQTSFFDYSGGGDTVLFQHMFWFFGHPEVYVIMIPVFGFTNTILSYYLRKRISARLSLMYSLYTIAFLGFFVWGHHMYMVGLSHTTRMLFSTLTVMISVPAATKLMHWSVTLINSSVTLELPLLFTFVFIFFFISGGISGMAVAHTGMDILFHDSFYVIGHFHVMLAGSAMFGSFSAFYFYFPAMFGLKFSRFFAYTHFIYYLLGQFMTVIPMMWVGYAGMPRRILDYPSTLGGWHSIISAGHMLSVAGLLAFFFMIADSKRQSKVWVPTTVLGVGRFNTRILFYRYEFNRYQFMAERVSSISHADSIKPFETRWNFYKNTEYLDLTPVTYSFHI